MEIIFKAYWIQNCYDTSVRNPATALSFIVQHASHLALKLKHICTNDCTCHIHMSSAGQNKNSNKPVKGVHL